MSPQDSTWCMTGLADAEPSSFLVVGITLTLVTHSPSSYTSPLPHTSHDDDTVQMIFLLVEWQSRFFKGIVDMLQWFAGTQIRNVAVSILDDFTTTLLYILHHTEIRYYTACQNQRQPLLRVPLGTHDTLPASPHIYYLLYMLFIFKFYVWSSTIEKINQKSFPLIAGGELRVVKKV